MKWRDCYVSDARIKREVPVDQGEYAPGQTLRPQQVLHPRNLSPLSVPYVDPQLIAYLRSAFPVSVARDKDLRDYDRLVGQQEIIDHLVQLEREQRNQT
jgi:hypothetical protein